MIGNWPRTIDVFRRKIKWTRIYQHWSLWFYYKCICIWNFHPSYIEHSPPSQYTRMYGNKYWDNTKLVCGYNLDTIYVICQCSVLSNTAARIDSKCLSNNRNIPVFSVKRILEGASLLHLSVKPAFPIYTQQKMKHPMYNRFMFSSSIDIILHF